MSKTVGFFVGLTAAIFVGALFLMRGDLDALRGVVAPQPVVAGEELCALTVAGSNTIGEKLAPAVAEAMLRGNGYAVEGPIEETPGERRLIGRREGVQCTIDIRSHGSAFSFKELTAGTAAIGMSSRAVRTGEIEALKAAGAGDFALDAAKAEHVVALDGIAIIVHPSNPLCELSKRQVKDMFLGKILGWGEVGGPDGAITLYARDDNSGTFQFFEENVLEGDAAWETAKQRAQRFESSSALVAAVGADPQAVGFVGMAYLSPAVRALSIHDGGPAFAPTRLNVRSESYPISRRLYLYVRPATFDQDANANALISYFKSAAAYDVVERMQYISLRPEFEPAPAAAAAASDPSPALACARGAAESEVYRAATTGARRLPSVVRFAENADALDSLARDDIERVLPAVREALSRGGGVRLIGHSDGQGDAAKNRKLALERADVIRQALESRGALGVQVESAGEMCPVADNDTSTGRRSNRRVEIWIVPPAA